MRFLLLSLTFLSSCLYAQEGPEPVLPFIPVSPEAGSLGKYGEIPTSLYTGAANIDVPLHRLTLRSLQVPISVSYHASGVKVSEVPSYVGLNWSLNAGGAIVRNIRGMEDDVLSGSGVERQVNTDLPAEPADQDQSTRNVWSVDNWTFLELVEDQAIDTEPDMFYFNFMGRTGKFFFDENFTAHFIPHQEDLEITEVIKTQVTDKLIGWVIKDGNGNTFKFGAQQDDGLHNGVEYTTVFSNGRYVDPVTYATAWYLVEVKLYSGETAYFNYEPKNERFEISYSESLVWGTAGPQEEKHTKIGQHTIISGRANLASISVGKGIIQFTSTTPRTDMIDGTRLDAVSVYYDGDLTEKYVFSYEYQGGSKPRLMLTKIQKFDVNNTEQPFYNFEYYAGLPPRNSNAQDYWGFYNGKSSNTNLIPRLPDNDHQFIAADRSPNHTTVASGSLRKISYPTGGHTLLYYQGHDYYDPNHPHLIEHHSYRAVASSMVSETEDNFTLTEATTVSYTVDFSFPGVDINLLDTYVIATLATHSGTVVQQWTRKLPEQDPIVYDGQIALAPGQYKLTLSLPCGEGYMCPANASASAEIEYSLTNTSIHVSQIAGGARIGKIENYDGIGQSPITTKKYFYTQTIGSSQVSSGALLARPIFEESLRIGDAGPPPGSSGSGGSCVCCENYFNYSKLWAVNQAQIGINDGAHVTYTRVEEVQEGNDGNVNGKKISFFTQFPRQYASQAPFTPVSNDLSFKNGLLDSVAIFKGSGASFQLISGEKHFYKFDTLNYYCKAFKLSRRGFSASCGDETDDEKHQAFAWTYYVLSTAWFYEKIKREYPVNGEEVLMNESRTYFHRNHLTPTKVVASSSDGSRNTSYFHYVKDYAGTAMNGTIADLTAKHIYNPIVEARTLKDGKVLGSSINIYDENGMVTETLKLETVIPLNDQAFNPSNVPPPGFSYSPVTKYKYDNELIKEVEEKGLITAFIWDHSKCNVIASVLNAAVEDVAFTSFEYVGFAPTIEEGGVLFSNNPSTNARAGTFSHALTSSGVSKSNLNPAITYAISIWAASGIPILNGIPFNVNEIIAQQGGWTCYRRIVTGITSANITGATGVLIDDLRIHPANCNMTTYTHRHGYGVSSVTDPNNRTTFYEYDNFGRLKDIRDNEGNLIQAHEYHYKQAINEQ